MRPLADTCCRCFAGGGLGSWRGVAAALGERLFMGLDSAQLYADALLGELGTEVRFTSGLSSSSARYGTFSADMCGWWEARRFGAGATDGVVPLFEGFGCCVNMYRDVLPNRRIMGGCCGCARGCLPSRSALSTRATPIGPRPVRGSRSSLQSCRHLHASRFANLTQGILSIGTCG